MSVFIIKPNPDENAYLLFSTLIDAPITMPVTRQTMFESLTSTDPNVAMTADEATVALHHADKVGISDPTVIDPRWNYHIHLKGISPLPSGRCDWVDLTRFTIAWNTGDLDTVRSLLTT